MKKFYLTTSIVYANNKPHIGFALELVQADAITRFHRQQGEDVRFLTGTDEHGMKILRAAKNKNKTPQKFVGEIVEMVKDLATKLNISYDDFIRTSDEKRHWPSVVKIWQKLLISNDLYKKSYQGLYCVGHESFLKESDLKDGLCPDHQTKPEVLEEENYFFRLSKYTDKVKDLIMKGELKIIPEFRKNEILSFLEKGLEDISFSRSSKKLSWGVPVPGDDSQTIYVWVDALINYISALGYAENSESFKKYWPADVQIIGKDILRFHAAIWPAMLLSADIPVPKTLVVHGFINIGGAKMSKTIGNIIDPLELVEKYGVDALRYYLLREIPAQEDGEFTIEKFEGRYQADLANGLGNLVARVVSIADKHKNVILRNGNFDEVDRRVAGIWEEYKKYLNEFRYNLALEQIWRLIKFCDEYIEVQRLWELPEKSKEEFGRVITELLLYLAHIALLIDPFLPSTSEKILKQLGIKKESTKPWLAQLNVKKGKALFPKLNVKA